MGNYILLEVGLFLNYQPVRPRPVFRGELKEAGGLYLPRIHASRSLGVAILCCEADQLYFGSIVMNECTFWHLETVMKKGAVVLRHSKKPWPPGKKKPAVERYSVDRQVCSL